MVGAWEDSLPMIPVNALLERDLLLQGLFSGVYPLTPTYLSRVAIIDEVEHYLHMIMSLLTTYWRCS